MKLNIKKLFGSRVELEVTLDKNEFQAHWDAAYDHFFQNVEIKGFRKGAAPKEIADQAIDKEKVFSEAAEAAVRATIFEISDERKWHLIDQPRIEVLESTPAFKYRAELALFPEVRLGNYKKIAKKVVVEFKDRLADIKIEDTEVEKSLEWVRSSRAKEVRVARGAKRGDLIEADIHGFVDGKPIPGAELEKDRFILGDSHLMDGFDKQLEGRSGGEKFSFAIQAPETYWQKDLRGKKVDFNVTIHGVFERELPVLDDQFVKSLGPSLHSVDELRKNIADGLRSEKEAKEKEKMRIRIIDEVVRDSKIELPAVMIERTLDGMVNETNAMMGPVGKDATTLRDKLKSRAEHRVASTLVVNEIMKIEKLEPTKEEIDLESKYIESIQRKTASPQEVRDYVYGLLMNKKVFSFLESLE